MRILTLCGIVVVKLKSLVEAGTEGLLNGEAAPAITVTGNLGRGSGYGFARNGNGQFGVAPSPGGIYQKRYTGYNQTGYIPGKKRVAYYVRMRTYTPTNPRTELQQSRRGKFADAVAAWQAMDEDARAPYKARAVRHSRRGRNLFIQEFMLQSES